jgi:polysaccharide deacetylase 2 family uncharacterized protein YibQ
MRRDELKQPLQKRSFATRLWAKRPSALACAYSVVLASFMGGGYYLTKQPMPFAGEPIVVAAIPPAQPEEVKVASVETLPESSPEETASIDEAPAPKAAYTVEEPVEQQTYQQDAAIFVSPKLPLTKAPINGLVELTAMGPLPKIGGGKKPSDAYARRVPLGVIHSDSPKIVIILGGMGLNEKLTAQATKDLPADVSFAFAPYGENLQRQVDKARSQGHEVLLQLPLEPVGYPASNPGPKTLLADADPAENQESLYWHMSRFTGYTGIVTYMGGRFLSSQPATKTLLLEMRKRGLLFIEDGTLPLSASTEIGKTIQLPVERGQTVIDADPNPDSINTALNLLEEEARTNGIAIGTGSGLDITIKTLAEWTKTAADRGVILVPANAAFKGRLG